MSGTLNYIAPEIILSGKHSTSSFKGKKADLWSMGYVHYTPLYIGKLTSV